MGSILPNFGKGNFNEFRYPFIKRASTFPSASSSSSSGHNNVYDYIVVGGGTAGCPLASTLSQKFNVLVLERGGVPFANSNVSFLQNFHIALADTSPTSVSQYFISTDGVLNSRARVLGGGTCINAGFYTRASTRYGEYKFFLAIKPFLGKMKTKRNGFILKV
ncbi:protein HOTHEAD-like [Prunus avium]|uniref:Protein HOTHEAD-like n=1 Tax=Prunus avium TaxID=42229 RepID=A0A6P5RLW9_PRUAV|nr:protein HOTHEAD-like [Prunus avium]